MPQSNYWIDRAIRISNSNYKKGDKLYQEVSETYDRAIKEIEEQLEKFYMKFATENGLSLADAKKILNERDLDEFKLDLEDYIRIAKSNPTNALWLQKLSNMSIRYRVSRLEALLLQVEEQVEILSQKQLNLGNLLVDIYADSYYHTAYEITNAFKIQGNFHKLDNKSIIKEVERAWNIDELNYSDRIWQNRTKLVNSLQQEISRMLITGDSPDTAIRNISNVMNVSRANAKRLINTEVAHIQNQAQYDCYNDLDVEQYEICSALDSRTCDECGELDYKVFNMKDRVEGVNYPPFHPNCRCCTVPHFDDNYTARASRDENGKTVIIEDMSYKEWYDQYVNN